MFDVELSYNRLLVCRNVGSLPHVNFRVQRAVQQALQGAVAQALLDAGVRLLEFAALRGIGSDIILRRHPLRPSSNCGRKVLWVAAHDVVHDPARHAGKPAHWPHARPFMLAPLVSSLVLKEAAGCVA